LKAEDGAVVVRKRIGGKWGGHQGHEKQNGKSNKKKPERHLEMRGHSYVREVDGGKKEKRQGEKSRTKGGSFLRGKGKGQKGKTGRFYSSSECGVLDKRRYTVIVKSL